MATENYLTHWVKVERGDGPEWVEVSRYPIMYPAGHANALAAGACDMRHQGVEHDVPVRALVWVTDDPAAASDDVMAGDAVAIWMRGPMLTADDARRILAGVHTESADDAAWREWAAAEHDAVVRDVLDEEQRRNRAAAEREAYADAVQVARGTVEADRLAEEAADAAAEGMFCAVPVIRRTRGNGPAVLQECGQPLPCLLHPARGQQD